MITEHQEIARYRVAEQLRAAEVRAQSRDDKPSGTRHGLAAALRRLADRLEPASRRLTEPQLQVQPQPRHRGTGLSVVR
ncbi:hypothetical protein AB0L70_01260 [Kribbella sp. NPDC051952]|jgi:hypothetical protein|uniref:hypothetical protein n=1 Tax=Kribbella sp. NPDC051952 TaxID=3154851 RepID=UPI00343E3557